LLNDKNFGPYGRASPRSIETPCRGTSLIKKGLALGTYSKTMPMALWWS
jgi:hypothetical protein